MPASTLAPTQASPAISTHARACAHAQQHRHRCAADARENKQVDKNRARVIAMLATAPCAPVGRERGRNGGRGVNNQRSRMQKGRRGVILRGGRDGEAKGEYVRAGG
eukprot:5982636-Pleurochrysis_carterae.AAC.1